MHLHRLTQRTPSRRDFLGRLSMGLSGIALGTLLDEAPLEGAAGASGLPFDVLPKRPHFAPKAKQVILLFQNGGPSQVDLFDPKIELARRHGEKPGEGFVNDVDPKKTGTWMGSPYKFARHGQSGMELSELIPHVAAHTDDMALIRSMVSPHSNHEQAIWSLNTGLVKRGRPALGSWVAYGLGTENQNLPCYVAILNPQGLPVDGTRNFSNGWMPPVYQGMAVRAQDPPVLNLEPRGNARAAAGRLELLQRLNREHLEFRSGQLELEARIASFDLAARMQLAATDVLDLTSETQRTHALYGTDDKATATYGRQCLLARRLVEHGVRFVQVLHQEQPWDTHVENNKRLLQLCRMTDRPTAALLTDLKQRGLLEETLVIWAGEFGRTPMSEGPISDKSGRDHHKQGFSLWMAGGGIKGGVTYGATDDFGYHAVENIVTTADFHATLLHLLGLDHRRLVYRRHTRDERLTDEHEARVVRAVVDSVS